MVSNYSVKKPLQIYKKLFSVLSRFEVLSLLKVRVLFLSIPLPHPPCRKG